MPNEPIDLIPMPAALLAFRLRSRLGCQKQVGIGHRGRSAKKYMNATIALQGIIVPGLLSLLFTLYTAFFAIHAIQHVADPTDRAVWLLIIIPFTIFGATFYFCTKYQQFKKIGKGGLVRGRRDANRAGFLGLSEIERQ